MVELVKDRDLSAGEESLVFRLRKRAEIRRQISGRKSVQEGKPDRLADLLEEAALELDRSRMLPMETAPRDGTPILVKIKADLSPFGIAPENREGAGAFCGLKAVMCNRGDISGWSFAAPVGQGGFADPWLEGWWPLPAE